MSSDGSSWFPSFDDDDDPQIYFDPDNPDYGSDIDFWFPTSRSANSQSEGAGPSTGLPSMNVKKQSLKKLIGNIFNNGKIINKDQMKLIHDNYLANYLGFKKMTREEYRFIKIYYSKYSKFTDQIQKICRENQANIENALLKQAMNKRNK